MKTDFTDRSGKPIYTGDILQFRLGKFAKKSGGPQRFRVVASRKGPRMVAAHDDTGIGWLMRKGFEENLTIVETRYREPDEPTS
jgi:hypothetical protein